MNNTGESADADQAFFVGQPGPGEGASRLDAGRPLNARLELIAGIDARFGDQEVHHRQIHQVVTVGSEGIGVLIGVLGFLFAVNLLRWQRLMRLAVPMAATNFMSGVTDREPTKILVALER